MGKSPAPPALRSKRMRLGIAGRETCFHAGISCSISADVGPMLATLALTRPHSCAISVGSVLMSAKFSAQVVRSPTNAAPVGPPSCVVVGRTRFDRLSGPVAKSNLTLMHVVPCTQRDPIRLDSAPAHERPRAHDVVLRAGKSGDRASITRDMYKPDALRGYTQPSLMHCLGTGSRRYPTTHPATRARLC